MAEPRTRTKQVIVAILTRVVMLMVRFAKYIEAGLRSLSSHPEASRRATTDSQGFLMLWHAFAGLSQDFPSDGSSEHRGLRC